MSESPTHRCRRASRCPDHERMNDGTKLGARINATDGLCETCTRHVDRAIGDLANDYVELDVLLRKTGSEGGEYVASTPELKTPIRLDVEALQAEMVHEACCWAESVAEVLGIRRDSQSDRDSRPGYRLQGACRLLGDSLSVLLALRGVAHLAWIEDLEPGRTTATTVVERDGIDGALVLLDLHHRVRSTAGRSRLVHRMPVPCPRCDRIALEREDGHEAINCSACGRRYTWDEYERLCGALVARQVAA